MLITKIFKIIFFFGLIFLINNCEAELAFEDWQRSGANNFSSKYSILDQINKNNIKNLYPAWTYHSYNFNVSETSPILAKDTLVIASDNFLIGLHPASGKEKWRTHIYGVARRGLTYANSVLYVPTLAGIYIVNPETGKIISDLGNLGKIGSNPSFLPPVATKDILISANFNSSVEAFNLKSGELIWKTSLIKDGVTPRIWSGLSFDEKNHLIYIVTSNPSGLIDEDIKNGGYASSLIAINSNDGTIAWQFQEIYHDLWDLDVVGAPIVIDILIKNKMIPAVIAVTKSGNTLFLNRINGKPIYPIKNRKVFLADSDRGFSSLTQPNIRKPMSFSSNVFDFKKDVTNLSLSKHDFITYKLRHARTEPFLPPSSMYDVVMFGLHGGAEWPGAGINIKDAVLVVPSNHEPWILRAINFDKDESHTINRAKNNLTYKNKCSICHGLNLNGLAEYEMRGQGDIFFPSLINITSKRTKFELTSIKEFYLNHHYIDNLDRLNKSNPQRMYEVMGSIDNKKFIELEDTFLKRNFKKIKRKLANLGIYHFPISDHFRSYVDLINSVKEEDLQSLYAFFRINDEDIRQRNALGSVGRWQMVLDQDGLPGSNPPWGFLTAIDLKDDGKILWRKPFGTALDSNGNMIKGDINFGGVMVTGSDIVFANGTRDQLIRAFDIKDGSEIWSAKMPAAGSVPPITYFYQGCQYVFAVATGGRFVGFDKQSDSWVAFKLSDCKNKQY